MKSLDGYVKKKKELLYLLTWQQEGIHMVVSEPQGICLMTVDILSTLPRQNIYTHYI